MLCGVSLEKAWYVSLFNFQNVHFLENPHIRSLFGWSGPGFENENLRLYDTTVGKQRAKTLKDQRGAKMSSRDLA